MPGESPQARLGDVIAVDAFAGAPARLDHTCPPGPPPLLVCQHTPRAPPSTLCLPGSLIPPAHLYRCSCRSRTHPRSHWCSQWRRYQHIQCHMRRCTCCRWPWHCSRPPARRRCLAAPEATPSSRLCWLGEWCTKVPGELLQVWWVWLLGRVAPPWLAPCGEGPAPPHCLATRSLRARVIVVC